MIVTIEAQQRILEKWNNRDRTTKEYIAFIEGMQAALDLMDKITKDILNK